MYSTVICKERKLLSWDTKRYAKLDLLDEVAKPPSLDCILVAYFDRQIAFITIQVDQEQSDVIRFDSFSSPISPTSYWSIKHHLHMRRWKALSRVPSPDTINIYMLVGLKRRIVALNSGCWIAVLRNQICTDSRVGSSALMCCYCKVKTAGFLCVAITPETGFDPVW